MAETFRSLIEESSSSPESRRRKELRQVHLHTRLIPLLRVVGYLLVAIGVLLHNQLILSRPSWRPFWQFLVVSLAYSLISWVLLLRFYRPRARFDLAFVFLVLDVFLFTAAVYVSGGEGSWLFFILLARVADQTTVGFRRALLFAHVVTASYGLMLLYIVLVDGRPIPPGFAVAVMIFLYGAGVYFALSARPGDRYRRRAAEGVTIGRELIGQLREQSEELERARVRAEAANEAKSRFLNNSSHELRTPLNAVLGLLQMLRGSELAPEQEELVSTAQSGAEKLLGTLDDIIDFSALEYSAPSTGDGAQGVSWVDLRGLVEASLRSVGESAEAKGLELSAAVDPGVPQAILTEPRTLRRILDHLVANGVKFTQHGSVAVSVRRHGECGLRLAVRDSGPGIPEESREKIFQPFSQLDTSAGRKHAGTGLGLALCRALVEGLGGEIGVRSPGGSPQLAAGGPAAGSEFWFTVEDRKGGSPDPGGQFPLPPGTRVLVVEDDLINQKITYHQLLALGVEAEVADDGLEALERLRDESFDLVLMDIQMPDLDGYDTTRELRRREGEGRRTPVVALTAHALPSDRRRCLDAGMDEHLSKPVSVEALRAVLMRWIPAVSGIPADPGPPSGSREVVDAETLERLRELGDRHGRDLLGEMVSIFLREVPGRIGRLTEALDRREHDRARNLAHSVRGSAKSLGLPRLAEVCGEIEDLLRSEALEEARALLPAVREAFRRTADHLGALESRPLPPRSENPPA